MALGGYCVAVCAESLLTDPCPDIALPRANKGDRLNLILFMF